MAACKRAILFGLNSSKFLTKSRRYDGLDMRVGRFNFSRNISQLQNPNGRRAFLVDTLALVRSLEAQGVPSKQAEAITSAITEVLNDSLENVSQSFVSKADMHKTEMLQEGNIGRFKSEVQSSQAMVCSVDVLVVHRSFGEVDSNNDGGGLSDMLGLIKNGTAAQSNDNTN